MMRPLLLTIGILSLVLAIIGIFLPLMPTVPLLLLAAAAIAGLFRNVIGRAGSHWVTILGVGASFALSAYVLYLQIYGGLGTQNISVYTWMVADGIRFEIGFLIDHLTALMMTVVTLSSTMLKRLTTMQI